MMHRLNPSIKIENNLSLDDYKEISELQKLCAQYDQTSLKQELDYKFL